MEGWKGSADSVSRVEGGNEMKEVLTMWRHTQMVVLVALSAAIYAAVLIPFKGFPIIPGYIELRPANAFPIVFGLLFGPAGAWGAALGNLIGLFPFLLFFALIVFNNAIMGGVLGPILLLALYPRVKRWGLLWTEIVEPEDASSSRLQRTGAILVWVGAIGAVVVGLILGLAQQAPGNLSVGIGLIPFLLVILIGSFMLGVREQVEAVEETMAAEAEESRT